MIIGLECWQFILMMTVILVLLLVPVVSWIVHRRYKNGKSKLEPVPPLMYITAVSTTRTSDVHIPHLPSPGDANFLPPSYEEICNNNKQLSVSTMSLDVDDDMAEYTAIGSQRSSMVLSTFYSDANSVRPSESSNRSDGESDSEDTTTRGHNNQGYDVEKGNEGIFVA